MPELTREQELYVYRLSIFKRMRVVDDERNSVAVLYLLLTGTEREEILCLKLIHYLKTVVEHADNVVLNRLNAGAGEGVVEFGEEKVAPCVVNLFLLVL